jgi:Rrf2 family transcriptional regulator, cysteine metabolism repressor
VKLSTRSRYGLRLMIALARSYGSGPRLLKEIADTENLSEKYLGQLVIPLKSAGYIRTVRGAKGGYEIFRDPAGVNPLEIIHLLEGDLFTEESVEPGSPGSLKVTTLLWERLRDSFSHILSSVTLADLARDSERLESQAPMYII